VLHPLVGQSIHIRVTDYPVTATLTACEDGFSISFEEEDEPSVSLSGRLADLIGMCISKDPKTALQQSFVDLQGSVKVLMDFSHFCQRFAPDIEGALSKWMGSNLAHHTYRTTKSSAIWLKKNIKLAQSDFVEYLQEELKLIPSMKEFKAFASDVYDIQSDVDRFEAKMQVLLHDE
jgi:ubiquinone biosynthesis protein UbiJ